MPATYGSALLMAHLQPQSFGHGGRASEKIRLTAIRAFTPKTVRRTGREVREIWAKHFEDRGPGHPYWLYTHIPFCPQICSFCQCSTSLRKSDEQVAAYLGYLEGEIEFFSDVSQPGLIQFQYVGGGTPNLLSEPQLERLLGTINRHFRFTSTSRRTFEFLPSSLRPGTLPLVRAHGFNPLSRAVAASRGASRTSSGCCGRTAGWWSIGASGRGRSSVTGTSRTTSACTSTC